MIELFKNRLTFRFPHVHPDAVLHIDFRRILRIPDDNRVYPAPCGLGRFPLEHIDDYADKLPKEWCRYGGIFLPMYQSEALFIEFTGDYPCAIKIAAGKINALSGEPWDNRLSIGQQDYVVVPGQRGLDGFNMSDEYIRQFVAMPLGEGFTAEKQITGKAEHGGLQIVVYPIDGNCYQRVLDARNKLLEALGNTYSPSAIRREAGDTRIWDIPSVYRGSSMGMGLGGLMRQKIYESRYDPTLWRQEHGLRCFVHLLNSEQYQNVTGKYPPGKPPRAKDYKKAELPWFDEYDEGSKALPGAETFKKLATVAAKMIGKKKGVLPDNESIQPKKVITIRGRTRVRRAEVLTFPKKGHG